MTLPESPVRLMTRAAVLLGFLAVGCLPGSTEQGTPPDASEAASTENATERATRSTAGEPASGSDWIALAGGRVLDGYGGPPIEDGVILVEGERIREIGPAWRVEIPEGARVISTEGMTVMPGLFDMHVHLMILGHGERLEAGLGHRGLHQVAAVGGQQLGKLLAGVHNAGGRQLQRGLKRPAQILERAIEQALNLPGSQELVEPSPNFTLIEILRSRSG